ncbi:ATP-binding cassette domain-containing protein [Candidatus Harpocratesius sp.]
MTKNEKEKWLNDFGLKNLNNVRIKFLSGGQKQRMAILCALLSEPDILILDEPTSHLDIKSANKIIDRIKTIVKDKKMTLLISTHSVNLAEKMDNVFELFNGQFRKSGKYFKNDVNEISIKKYKETLVYLNSDGKILIPEEFLNKFKSNYVKIIEKEDRLELIPIKEDEI